MRYIWITFCIFLYFNLYSQDITPKNDNVNIKLSSKDKYIIEFENNDFKVYFSYNDFKNVLDTIRISQFDTSFYRNDNDYRYNRQK